MHVLLPRAVVTAKATTTLAEWSASAPKLSCSQRAAPAWPFGCRASDVLAHGVFHLSEPEAEAASDCVLPLRQRLGRSGLLPRTSWDGTTQGLPFDDAVYVD